MLLSIEHLSVAFGETEVVHDISLALKQGETLALVGESGSGKSVTAASVLRLLPNAAHYPAGRIVFDGTDILTADKKTLQSIRGGRIGMIFQEPMSALNPLHTIGKQLRESLLLHQNLSPKAVQKRIRELLKQVELSAMTERLDAYPHQLSGGQRQRIMIAMAIANRPDLLIADEPTTALDVTVQAEILALLRRLQEEEGMAMLFISHDLNVVRHVSRQVAVMKDGKIVEYGDTERIFSSPQQEYTQRLLAAVPSGNPVPLSESHNESESLPLLKGEQITVRFPAKKGFFGQVQEWTTAVDNVSLTVRSGETLGIVGESGSGKTTLALALLRLLKSDGTIRFDNTAIDSCDLKAMRPLRKHMQIVFQDPYASLNPRLTIGQIIGEGLDIHGVPDGPGASRDEAVERILLEVGLLPEHRHRYPHEFSGGQRQRINIARAVVLEPRLIVFDEPTSALDLLTQAQILDLLKKLQREHHLTYMFISHDLRVVQSISHKVLVLRDGKEVEAGDAAHIFHHPEQPYTQRLVEAAML